MRVKRSFVGLLLVPLGLLLLFTVVLTTTAANDSKPDTVASLEVKWATYSDPQFDFTIEYPETWKVYPREEKEGYIGGTLSFVDSEAHVSECGETSYTRIEIGLYVTERKPSVLLDDWSEKYDEATDAFQAYEIQVIDSAKDTTSTGREIYQKEAISPLTEYTYINVPHDRTVWFIWTNSINGEHKDILDHMADTLRFGKDTPSSLQDAYGQMFPPLLSEKDEDRMSYSLLFPATPGQLKDVSSDYIVPVNVSADIKCGSANASLCNGTHRNSAAEAVDIIVGTGTSVKNSAASYTDWVGWNNSGYGWLVKMHDKRNHYVAYYAHLSQFNVSNLYPGSWPPPWPEPRISQGVELGLSGRSGSANMGSHLHYHVRTTGWGAVQLDNINNLNLTINHSNCNKATCAQIEALPNDECTCGSVN